MVGGLAFQIGSISAGYAHACALTTAGAGVCWGTYKSQSSVDSTTPAFIVGYTFVQIAAGYMYSLGLLTDGMLISWGSNGQYCLGIGDVGGSTPTNGVVFPPDLVTGNYTWASLADTRMSSTACAYTTSGALMCWGAK